MGGGLALPEQALLFFISCQSVARRQHEHHLIGGLRTDVDDRIPTRFYLQTLGLAALTWPLRGSGPGGTNARSG